jgi:hypothetical protein
MWEEHPEYQKFQAKLTGLGIVGCLIYMAWEEAFASSDWQTLKGILLFGAGLVAALGMLSGVAWFLVKIFTRGHPGDSVEKKNSDS